MNDETLRRPGTIHHFTSAAGLQGILGKRELWLTDIDFLNDEEEVRYALRVARNNLRGVVRAYEDTADEDGNAWSIGMLQTAIKKLNEQLKVDDVPVSPWEETLYVASFCKSPDVLSMWRAYGASAEGYSVEFDAEVLEDALSGTPQRYGLTEDEHEALIATNIGLRGEISNVRYGTEPTNFDLLNRVVSKADPGAPVTSDEFAEVFRWRLARECALVKHPAFVEEDEVRLVLSPEGDNSPRPSLRSGAGHLVPYQVIQFPHEAIKSITVGPSRNRLRNARAIHKFLDFRDRDEFGHVEVKVSKTPLV